MDDDRAVEQLSVAAQRRADDKERKELARGFGNLNDAALDPVEKSILKQQIVDRVGGDPELGKNHQCDFAFIAAPRQIERLGDIERGITDLDAGHTGRDPHELVAIRGPKVHTRPRTTAHDLHSFGRDALGSRRNRLLMSQAYDLAVLGNRAGSSWRQQSMIKRVRPSATHSGEIAA